MNDDRNWLVCVGVVRYAALRVIRQILVTLMMVSVVVLTTVAAWRWDLVCLVDVGCAVIGLLAVQLMIRSVRCIVLV